jgi:hypothetical protein
MYWPYPALEHIPHDTGAIRRDMLTAVSYVGDLLGLKPTGHKKFWATDHDSELWVNLYLYQTVGEFKDLMTNYNFMP